MIAWNCKYTPIELISALGGEPFYLNRESEDFSCAECESHSSICCHIKAFLQNCSDMGIREAVIVNCCDSMRCAYDILKANGSMDFVFMMDLPHKTDNTSRQVLKRELLRLADEYGKYKKTVFDDGAFLKLFPVPKPARPDGDFIAVAGARVGEKLFADIASMLPLPAANMTCAGNRGLGAPDAAVSGLDALMEWYAGELMSQLPCMRMCDASGRSKLWETPHLRGIVYNTVKFCDYYAFEYDELRKKTELPMLKIESDFLAAASGQLSTRLTAFAENKAFADEAAQTKKTKGGKYVAGIDSGSTTTNLVILKTDGSYVGGVTVRTGPRAAGGADKAFAEAEKKFAFTRDEIAYTVATGYGRNSVPHTDEAVTEITCHALGAHHLDPSVRTVIDIGGQDSKVIGLDADGSVRTFVMNDKCAAGTGRFLELMATTLEMDVSKMSKIGLEWKEDVTISSVCTVFAESEVVSLIADNHTAADIVHGLNKAVALKTSALAGRGGGQPSYMMTGGVARNAGVVSEIEKKIGHKLIVPDEPDLCGALGAALTALSKI